MTPFKKAMLAIALAGACGIGPVAPAMHDTPGAIRGSKPSGSAKAKRNAEKRARRKARKGK